MSVENLFNVTWKEENLQLKLFVCCAKFVHYCITWNAIQI